jgi:ligand-binding sensor domain-containing protein
MKFPGNKGKTPCRALILTASLLLFPNFCFAKTERSHSQSTPGGTWKNYTNIDTISDFDSNGKYTWCATGGGAVRWDKNSGTHTVFTIKDGLISNNLRSSGFDSNGRAWFSNKEGSGIVSIEGGNIRSHTLENGAPSVFTTLKSGPDGKVWFGCEDGGGIYSYDGKKWELFLPAVILDGKINSVAEDVDGSVWFATDTGVWRFGENTWKKYTSESGLPDNKILSAAVDINGVKWFGTPKGASSFDGISWKKYTSANGLVANGVAGIAVDLNNVKWFCYLSDAGVTSFDGTAWITYKTTDGLKSNRVVKISVDYTNTKWFSHGFGSSSGISGFDGTSWKSYTFLNSGIASSGVNDYMLDRKGLKWFVTDRGISSYDGSVWNSYTPQSIGLPDSLISAAAIDSSNVKWFGSAHGLASFDSKNWKTYALKEGFKNEAVTALMVDSQGVLWIGREKGMSSFNGNGFVHYPAKDGLLSSKIREIACDPHGVMWFATDRGLTSLTGSTWKTYNIEDGLDRDSVQQVKIDGKGAVICRTDSMLWTFDGSVFQSYTISGFTGGARANWIKTKGDLVSQNNKDTGKTVYYDLKKNMPGEIDNYSSAMRLLLDEQNVLWRTEWLAALNGSVWKVYRNNVPGNVRFMAADHNNIKWFLTPQELFRFDGIEWKLFPLNRDSLVVTPDYNLAVDSKNRIWFLASVNNKQTSRNDRMFLGFDGKDWKTVLIPSTLLSIDYRTIVFDLKDVLWAALSSSSIIRFDGSTWKIFDGREGLPSFGIVPNLNSIVVDQKNVKWFGSSQNLISYNDTTLTYYQRPDKESTETYSSLAVDHSNSLWAATRWNMGRSAYTRFNGAQWKIYPSTLRMTSFSIDLDNKKWAPISGTGVLCFDDSIFTTYTTREGLLSNDVRTMAIDLDGVKWFGADAGVSTFDDRKQAAAGTLPADVAVRGCYPNPFNARITLSFDLYSWGAVKMTVYSIMGQKIRTLVTERFPAGTHSLAWDGTNDSGRKVSSGVYLYRLEKNGGGSPSFGTATGRMVFLK